MKIGLKLVIIFLVLSFLVGFVGYFGIKSTNSVQKNNQISIEIAGLESLLDESLVQILQLIETQNLDDYYNIKSNIENLRKKFDVAYKESDKNIPGFARIFEKDLDGFTKISNGIISVHKKKLVKSEEFAKRYVLEKEFRHNLRALGTEVDDIELNKNIALTEYYSKETIFQYKDQEHLDKWLKSIENVKKRIEELNIPKSQKNDLLQETELYKNIAQRIGEIVIEQGEIETEEHLKIRQLIDIIDKLEKDETKIVNNIQVKNKTLIKNTYSTLLAVITISFLISIALGLYISSSISKPIQQLHETTQQLEKGDFDARANIKTGDELAKLGETLNKSIETLGRADEEHKKLDRAKTKFLSITSHELRSPMTPMRAQLQMLIGGYFGKLNKKQKEAADIVLRNTTRLDNIIQDFLEISRIETARLKFKFIKTNLREHIERLIEEMKGFMPEKNIKIIANIGKLPIIVADPDRVMQVLRNLINNAMKFSPKNSEILVTAQLKDNRILFSVKDHGIGLSPVSQRRIFEPFFQAEQTMYREHGGNGLGLSICKGIVESQNGRIWVESKEAEGSTFYFTVLLKPVKEMKPIKMLFSEQENIEENLKQVFVEYLGPLGEQEFDSLNKQSLTYETAKDYIENLNKKRIISKDTLADLDKEFLSLFEVKKVINAPEEIKKKYVEILGPLGEKRFNRLRKLTINNVIGDINNLEEIGVLETIEASRFRDYIMGSFRQEMLERKEPLSKEELVKTGLIKSKNLR